MLDNDAKIVDAILGDDEKSLEFLLANPDVNPNGTYCNASYLCLAIMNKKVRAVEQLCDHILVDLNTRSKALGETPLQYAIQHDRYIALYLLKRKANPNVTDGHGNTALHSLMKTKAGVLLGFDDLVEALLKDKRLNVLAKNHDGKTAYELAPKHARPLLAKNLRIKMWLKSHPELAPKEDGNHGEPHDVAKSESLDAVEDWIKKTDDEVWAKANNSIVKAFDRANATIRKSDQMTKDALDKAGYLSDVFGKATRDTYVKGDFDKNPYKDSMALYKKNRKF